MIEKINKILNIDESYKAPEKVMNILYNKVEREKICKELLKAFNNDVSYDWFREYYEQEQAQRKTNKQDFTPQCVTELVSKIVGNKTPTYDCCSGTGGITISKWYNDCLQESPFNYNPAEHLYVCEEYSDIAITLQTYTHTSNKAKAKAIDKFNKMFETQEEKVKFTKAYKGNVCCINKRRGKCDFIGSIKDVSEYLVETTDHICDVINGVKEDKVYNIVPKIIGITHDEQGNYVGG